MKASVWGYMFLVLGLIGIVLINVFGEITIGNEQNYYSLKEVTKAAMLDAVDEHAYLFGIGDDGVTQTSDPESVHCSSGVPGTVRIIKERFVELFLLKFSESVNIDNDYKIIFNDIDECPPKVTVTVISTKNYSAIQKIIGVKEKDVYTSDIDVTNVITGILESKEEFTK